MPFTPGLAVDANVRRYEQAFCDVFLKHRLPAPNLWRLIAFVKACIMVKCVDILVQNRRRHRLSRVGNAPGMRR